MMQISDEFVDDLVRSACVFAKHRKSTIVEVKDVQLYLGN
jgi:transcription initiation factor TFIID subunit TAF12